jgi:hypothetical protein
MVVSQAVQLLIRGGGTTFGVMIVFYLLTRLLARLSRDQQ